MITIQRDVQASEEFIQAVATIPEAIQDSLKIAAQYLRTLVVERTPWVTGLTAGSWSSVEAADGGFSFGNPLPHTQFLEYGYENVKNPKGTIPMDGRYYSKKAPGGIIKPIINNPEVIDHVVKIFTDGVVRRLNAGA
jgi:hypothetical protein